MFTTCKKHLLRFAPALALVTTLSVGCADGGMVDPHQSMNQRRGGQSGDPVACQIVDDRIQPLCDATALTVFYGNNQQKSKHGLIGKLNEASAKLVEAKVDDAVAKLMDFVLQLEWLRDATKAKVDVDDANILISIANALISLLQPDVT